MVSGIAEEDTRHRCLSRQPVAGLCVDGSDPCRAAVRWAARDAAMRNAPFTLVHVVNVRYTTMPQTSLPVGFGGWLEEQGQTFLEEAELDREGQWSFAGQG